MRLGFFGQSGPFAPPALRALLPVLGRHQLVVAVEGQKRLAGRHEHRVVKADPRPWPKGDELAPLASAAGVEAIVTREVNDGAVIRRLREHDLDLIVCVGFDRLFSAELLAAARHGGVNAHPSLLPLLRGPAPLFWALQQGLRHTGVTLHRLDAKEDHGPIFGAQRFQIPRRATGAEIYGLAGALAGELLAGFLSRVESELPAGRAQEHARATRAPRPKPEDVHLDPSAWKAEALVDFCCGAPYFRAPWLRFGDDIFFVRRGIDVERARKLPAQYVLAGSTLVVQCADGVAHLEIQV
ncbi:MAG: hypothetical protein HY903_03435 [Deltaproteobacteria bacterium]|nr:hypothetical protein [Deltaproteobacteria bacterium]